ncbi:MAG: secretin N-terminal domain-containing protein, partial [Planctomycetota bacterium]
LGGGLGGAAGGGGIGGTGQRPALMLSLSGIGPDGAPLIDLRITVDERTNSLIAAGSRSDLAIIEALIARLEDADIQFRRNEAFRLRNAQAADVAASLSDFITKTLTVMRTGGQLTPFQEIQRDIVVVAEPISNTLLISATPQYMDDVLRIVSQLDLMPPQVAVQVLVAEVDLTNSNEFGVEIGLQSPVLFRRGVTPDPSFSTGTNPTASPGFPFNTTVLGNNPAVSPAVVGYQSLSNLGVGRVSSRSNIGGFVFSASSNSVNILVRALQTQGRLDILSRPQIMTLDNQTAIINVGQEIPIVTSSNVTATGVVQTNIERKTSASSCK